MAVKDYMPRKEVTAELLSNIEVRKKKSCCDDARQIKEETGDVFANNKII